MRGLMLPTGIHDQIRGTLLVWLAVGLVSLTVVGCKAPPDWSTEAWSPDKKYLARAVLYVNGGFGTDYEQTAVSLRCSGIFHHSDYVVTFDDAPPGPDGMKVGLHWIGPRHLEITYRGKRTFTYVADHYHDVIITERDLSSASANSAE